MGPTIPGDGDGDNSRGAKFVNFFKTLLLLVGNMKIITNLKCVKGWSSGSEGRSGIHF